MVSTLMLCVVVVGLTYGQFSRTDSIGNFYVEKNHLLWQKIYTIKDINKVNEELKKHDFTANLNILGFKKATISNPTKLNCDGVPMYAKDEFTALIEVFIQYDQMRVSVKDFTFPNFVENRYYNGMNSPIGGTLDHYMLRRDGQIKRTESTFRVLECFDNSFSDLFDEVVYATED